MIILVLDKNENTSFLQSPVWAHDLRGANR